MFERAVVVILGVLLLLNGGIFLGRWTVNANLNGALPAAAIIIGSILVAASCQKYVRGG